jgi:hypothetical protein
MLSTGPLRERSGLWLLLLAESGGSGGSHRRDWPVAGSIRAGAYDHALDA